MVRENRVQTHYIRKLNLTTIVISERWSWCGAPSSHLSVLVNKFQLRANPLCMWLELLISYRFTDNEINFYFLTFVSFAFGIKRSIFSLLLAYRKHHMNSLYKREIILEGYVGQSAHGQHQTWKTSFRQLPDVSTNQLLELRESWFRSFLGYCFQAEREKRELADTLEEARKDQSIVASSRKRSRLDGVRPAAVFGESSLVDTSVDSTLSSLVLQRGRDGRSGRRLCRRRPQGRARKVLYLIRFQCLNTIPNFSHLTVGFLLPKWPSMVAKPTDLGNPSWLVYLCL